VNGLHYTVGKRASQIEERNRNCIGRFFRFRTFSIAFTVLLLHSAPVAKWLLSVVLIIIVDAGIVAEYVGSE